MPKRDDRIKLMLDLRFDIRNAIFNEEYEAAYEVRTEWECELRSYLDQLGDTDPAYAVEIRKAIKRLRRQLHYSPEDYEVREQTRERVRKFRERRALDNSR